jgi:hypothetical protein
MSTESEQDTCDLFVDEAGVPEIFDAKGRVIIGREGCSHYFLLGMAEISEPEKVAAALVTLREQLLADPYLNTAPSFHPTRKKTALLFHAKDDLPEVRIKVFDLLRSFGDALRFRAVVCDKQEILLREQERRETDPRYRYNPDSLYDELARALFGKFSRFADRYHLRIAKRGNKERNAALRTAIEQAEEDFSHSFGFARSKIESWDTLVTNPRETVCLQATDYFLWALQRFYEPRAHPETDEIVHEDRYLNAVWAQVSQIHDLHFGPLQGSFLTSAKPLTVETRFGSRPSKKKKPHV